MCSKCQLLLELCLQLGRKLYSEWPFLPLPATNNKILWANADPGWYLAHHPSCQLHYVWTLSTWGHKGSLTSSVLTVTTYITVSCLVIAQLSLLSLSPIHMVAKSSGCPLVTQHISLERNSWMIQLKLTKRFKTLGDFFFFPAYCAQEQQSQDFWWMFLYINPESVYGLP